MLKFEEFKNDCIENVTEIHEDNVDYLNTLLDELSKCNDFYAISDVMVKHEFWEQSDVIDFAQIVE